MICGGVSYVPAQTTGTLANAGSVVADASSRARVSQLTTLFDGKTLNTDDPLIWDTAGTGSTTFSENNIILSVTAGQYVVRQTKHFFPYFSGKPQVIEPTYDSFAPAEGLVKRVGYFSSSAVAPYIADLDGWFLESNGPLNNLFIVIVRKGVEKLRVPFEMWSGYNQIADYDWNTFTVNLVDFLWLGGAVFRFFLKNPNGGFTLAHQLDYSGTEPGTFMLSPNQPVRYELRSTTGVGTFREVCSQVSTEGSLSENGVPRSMYSSSLVRVSAIGTIYPIKGVRKGASFRDTALRVHSVGVGVSSSDSGVILLLLNPTLSAPLTWVNNGYYEEGSPGAGQTVTAEGYVIASLPLVAAGQTAALTNSVLAWLGSKIDNTRDEIILAYMPLTVNQSVVGTLTTMRY